MLNQLKLLIRSGYPIITIEAPDETEACRMVRQAADSLGWPLYEWSVTGGLSKTRPALENTGIKGGKAADALKFVLDNKGDEEIYLFKDLGPHTKDPLVQRQLRELSIRPTVAIVMVENEPPPDSLRRLTVTMRMPFPEPEVLGHVIRDTFRRIKEHDEPGVTVELTKRDMEQMVNTLRGLTVAEATRVVASAIHDDQRLTADDLPRMIESKRNLLQSTGCLESISVNVAPEEIGGLDNLKRWLQRRRRGFTAEARNFGLEAPRGILLLGVQGCGKSLCAKAVAAEWCLPLLRMDPGVLYQKFVGESENRLRAALTQAESMAPAILWIDEIEKAFASASAESADGGLSQRMFGTLLSWMQDHRHPIFMVATANNIQALPPELMRKGRFDEVFFVDLPTAAVRRNILAIHLKRRQRDPEKFQLDRLVAATDGFSGAELEQLVISALFAAFANGTDLTDAHLMNEAGNTRPLSALMAERIAELRAWADGRCVPAD
jgi:SpoVK/Ycf46/Vps4 family AAA+-type ATPase